jgi:hypothetical protein
MLMLKSIFLIFKIIISSHKENEMRTKMAGE